MDDVSSSDTRSLYRIGGTAAALQRLAMIGYAVVAAELGPKPAGAEEYFAVVGAFATESTFSMLYLGRRFVTAAEAVIASDICNGTAGYMGGILPQGSGVMISIIMLRSKDFSKVTAYAGLLGNGLDLVQHILHPFAPSVAGPIQIDMGVFCIVWYQMPARELFRLARTLPGESPGTIGSGGLP